jgi:hypothetical protein
VVSSESSPSEYDSEDDTDSFFDVDRVNEMLKDYAKHEDLAETVALLK